MITGVTGQGIPFRQFPLVSATGTFGSEMRRHIEGRLDTLTMDLRLSGEPADVSKLRWIKHAAHMGRTYPKFEAQRAARD